jgi:hypothetical protein
VNTRVVSVGCGEAGGYYHNNEEFSNAFHINCFLSSNFVIPKILLIGVEMLEGEQSLSTRNGWRVHQACK